MPKVSVVINCYNGEQYLEETFNSIMAQTFQDFEIVFFDNCSTDNSSSIAKKFGHKVKYFKSQENIALGNARNEALKCCSGEYITFIDCDDFWDPSKLEKQVVELDKDSSVGMVFTNFKRLNMLSGVIDIFDKRASYLKLPFSELVGAYSFCLSSFMIRKEALKRLDHYFNVNFKYAEEFELFSRVAYYYYTIYLPEPLVTYRIHKNMNTLKLQERIGYEYNIALQNLIKLDKDLQTKYPQVVKRIEFARDFSDTKYLMWSGERKKIRKLMRPYIFYNKRAFLFYICSYLTDKIFIMCVNIFYKNRI